jgi:deoxyribose-phosphate aldolase
LYNPGEQGVGLRSPIPHLISEACEELDALGIPSAAVGRPPVPRAEPVVVVPADLNGLIEHLPAKADASAESIATLCEEAEQNSFRGICIPPTYLESDRQRLPAALKVAVLIGLPRAANSTAAKVGEARRARAAGADEIDMIIELDDLKAGNYREVYHDIRQVVRAAGGKPVKVSLETSLLDEDAGAIGTEAVLRRKIIACLIAERAGAAYIKTSTGLFGGAATTADVAVIREAVGDRLGIEAAGGIRDFRTAAALIGAGADRIGSSASPAIVNRDFEKKDSARLTHAWNSFNYQATQRMQSFQFYLIFIAALIGAYFRVLGAVTKRDQFVIAVVGALVSAAFGFLDIRNAELVHCAREALLRLEPEYGLIIRSNEDMSSRRIGLERELPSAYKRFPRLIRRCSSFRFWLKKIYFGVCLLSVAAAVHSLVG